MEALPTFSVIIVSWNTCALTLQAIRSVYAQGDSGVEVIVVDNASSDDSVERIRKEFPDVRLIVNAENLGYARANNMGLAAARGDYFLLLNSDAELLSRDTFEKLRRVFEAQPEVAAVGAKLVLPNGKVQALGRPFLTLKRLIKEQLLFAHAFADHDASPLRSPVEAEYIDGAFLAVRRKTVEQIGMLDESFFMYGEDMDWCRRMKAAGWRLIVLPELVVLHHHAAGSKQILRKVLLHNALNNCRYLARYESAATAKAAFDVYLLGMALRVPLSLFRRNRLARSYLGGFIDALKMRGRLEKLLQGEE